MDLRNVASSIPGISKVQEYLKGLNFPASKQDITNKAQENGADNNVMSMLQKLPDKMFNSQSDLMNEINNIK